MATINLNEEVRKALEKYPTRVVQYKKGNRAVAGMFVGEVMKTLRLTTTICASAIYSIVCDELAK